MSKTIGNPFSWFAQRLNDTSHHLGEGGRAIGAVDHAPVEIRQLAVADITDALRKGLQDFMALRTDVIAIVMIYPVIGLLLVWFALDQSLLPMIFPLVTGFALLGPVAAIGLYEMSRRRELGESVSWADALHVIGSPSFVPIVTLGAFLASIYIVWLIVAVSLFNVTIGPESPASVASFFSSIFSTFAGWILVVAGISLGFVFAALVLAISVVSFPLLLDRRVGFPTAVATSIRVARENPGVIGLWGAVVVALLGIGVLTLFIGLIVTLPILGHATWHLYRHAVVEPDVHREN